MKTQAPSILAPVWFRTTDLTVVSGRGCTVTADDGTEYLDFSAGIGVVSTGHCHPRVVEAIREQAGRFIHAQVNCYRHPLLEQLGEALGEVTPDGIDRFFFTNSGAEAIEGAVKLARAATGRPNVVVFQGSFHGRTALTMAMTASKTIYRAGYSPLPAGIHVSSFPYWFRTREAPEEASARCLADLRLLLKSQTAPSETAAVVIEPVLGEGGYIVPPVPFLRGLEEICREHDLLLVLDEIQSGFGRTGRYFALEHFGVEPDILVMAKGIASGFPLAAIGARSELMERWAVGAHGGTYGGNPIGCAAALATIDVIRDERLVENAAERGEQLLAGLRALQGRHPAIGDLRGLGLMIGLELVDGDGDPDPARATAVLEHCLREGRLVLLTCGTYGNVIRLVPPLVLREAEAERALAALGAALEATG